MFAGKTYSTECWNPRIHVHVGRNEKREARSAPWSSTKFPPTKYKSGRFTKMLKNELHACKKARRASTYVTKSLRSAELQTKNLREMRTS